MEPTKAEWHDRLGRLLMDELGLLEDAGIALRNALACGSLDKEVFTRALACALAVGDEAGRDDLLGRIAAEYGPEAPDGAIRVANRIAFWLIRKYGGPDGPASGDLPDGIAAALGEIGLSDPLAEDIDRLAEDRPGQLADDQPTEITGEPVPVPERSSSADEELRSVPPVSPGDQIPTGEPAQPFRHLQLRRAATGFVYMDVYEPFDAPDFIDTVLRERRRAWIQAAMMAGQLAQTAFFLLRCPKCAVELASNRAPGSSLRCQRCSASYPVTPLRDAAAETLMSGLNQALGVTSQPMDGWELLVALQVIPTPPFPAPTRDVERELAALLQQRGIELLPRMHPGVLLTVSRGVAGGALRIDQPWIGGRWRYPPGSIGSPTRAPEQILSVIDEARQLLAPTRLASITLTYNASPSDPFALLLLGLPAELEALLRARQAEKSDASLWLALASTAQLNGDLEGALGYAQSASAADPGHAPSWARLGSLHLASGDVKGAVAAAEHALRLDPAEREAYQVLATGYREQGRDSEAREMAARARAARPACRCRHSR